MKVTLVDDYAERTVTIEDRPNEVVLLDEAVEMCEALLRGAGYVLDGKHLALIHSDPTLCRASSTHKACS